MAGPSFGAPPEPVIEDDEFLHPHLPGLRTSNDGRIALEVESNPIQLYLLTPEKVDVPWHLSKPGTSTILADQKPFRGGFGHSNDCYDLTHGGWQRMENGQKARLYGTPMTVEVANPKTPNAKIVNVRMGQSVAGPLMPSPVAWEPMATRDGRLFVARFGKRYNVPWFNERTGKNVEGKYELVYSLLEDDAADCDVRGWQQFKPIANAPYDSRMKGKYGIAAFPFRSGQGETISETTDFGGTYPWVDRGDSKRPVSGGTLDTGPAGSLRQYAKQHRFWITLGSGWPPYGKAL